MRIHHSIRALLATSAVSLLTMFAGSSAQAREVYWSVGVASPGVHLGVSNAPPVLQHRTVVVVASPHVYYSQPPVYYAQPQVVYGAPQLVYGQPQVFYQPPPYYAQSGWAPQTVYRNWGHGFHGHHGNHGYGYRDDRRGFTDGQRGDGHRGRAHR